MQAERRVHESDVCERLREVAEEGAAVNVDLFRKEPEIVGSSDKRLEDVARLVLSSSEGQRLDEPEAAGKKCPLAGRQTVVRAYLIAIQQIFAAECTTDRVDGSEDAPVVRFQKTDARKGEKAGIQLVAIQNGDEVESARMCGRK